MQLDADEDGEPFFKPPAVASLPTHQRADQGENEEHRPTQHRGKEDVSEDSSDQQVPPVATNAEQKD